MNQYYVEVNPGSPDRKEFQELPVPYNTKGEALLALIDWLNEHFPLGWISNSQGQYMPDYECLAGFIAGRIIERDNPDLTGREPQLGGKHDDHRT